jgi:hypothetical protein
MDLAKQTAPAKPDLVEVRLNSFLYRFRRLTWIDESTIKIPTGEDARTHILAYALHDVSGMPVTSPEDAERIVRAIPYTFRWRIWVIYRGNLPSDRYFTMNGLFEAPEPQVYNQRLTDGEKATDTVLDEVARKHGATEASEAHDLGQQMLANAVKSRKEQAERLSQVKPLGRVRGAGSRLSTSFTPSKNPRGK